MDKSLYRTLNLPILPGTYINPKKKDTMRTLLLSTALLGLTATVWAENPVARMGISDEEFKAIQAEMAEKKKEQEPLLKKLNEQAKKTADCRMEAAKLVTPTNVQTAIQTCDEEARAAIEKLSPTGNTPPGMPVSGTVSGSTAVSGSNGVISTSIVIGGGSSPSAPQPQATTSPSTAGSPTVPATTR